MKYEASTQKRISAMTCPWLVAAVFVAVVGFGGIGIIEAADAQDECTVFDMEADPGFAVVPADSDIYYDGANDWYHLQYAETPGDAAERFVYGQVPTIPGDFRLEYEVEIVSPGYSIYLGLSNKTTPDDFVGLQFYYQPTGAGPRIMSGLFHDGEPMTDCWQDLIAQNPANTGYTVVVERTGDTVEYELWDDSGADLIASLSTELDSVDPMNYFFIWCYGGQNGGIVGEARLKSVSVCVDDGDSVITDFWPEMYLVPAAAHADGVGTTIWRSDIVLHNAGSSSADVELFFLKKGQDNSDVPGHGATVSGGSSLALDDIVGEEFGETSATGAILVGSDEPLEVTSRTFNDAAAGTFGQFIPGSDVGTAIARNEEVRLMQLTRNTDFRTNIGFANATDQSLDVDVELYRANGSYIAHRSYTIKPYGYFQKTDIIPNNVSDAYAVVSSSTSGAEFFTYASVVDNDSGDPVLIQPVAGSSSDPLYVPASAHIGGTAGTNWRTDLEVHNPDTGGASFTVELLRRDQVNTSPSQASFSLQGGQSVRYDDVLQSMFGFTGAAALRITPTHGTVMVTSRTYNDVPGGTYGQFIAGYPLSEAITARDEARLIQLSRSSSSSSGFRTNIGFAEAAGVTTDVEVRLHTGSGQFLGTVPVTLRQYEHKQVNDIFADVTGGSVDDGYAVITTQTPNAGFFAYASVVDNSSGDPIYVPASGGSGASGGEQLEEITITLPGGVTMELVHIPAGTFMMGSPSDERGRFDNEDLHQVTLTEGYYMGKYEVTQAQWEAVMGENPASGYGVGDDYPVYYVSWNDIAGDGGFIDQLNDYLGTTKFRLPTEAEWERAARAGTHTPFSFGDDTSCAMDDCSFCNLFDQYMVWCGNDIGRAEQVGSRQPNSYGLYDMNGNLYEWVADRYAEHLGVSAVTDPTGATSGYDRVRRGGFWANKPERCRSACRTGYTASNRRYYIGFRLARSE